MILLARHLSTPESVSVGIWGQRRKHYLEVQREPIYAALLLSSKLDSHLAETDTQAETMFFQKLKQLAEQECITEQLKSENQMDWEGRMNNIRDRATEIVHAELIFT